MAGHPGHRRDVPPGNFARDPLRAVGPLVRRLRSQAEALLARADLALVHRSNYERWLEEDAGSDERPAEPVVVDPELTADNPLLVDLRRRYRGHPAAAVSQWSDTYIAHEIDLNSFRADNAYVWQRRLNTDAASYALTAFYLQRHAALSMFDRLGEDRLFGVTAFDIDGRLVSRDLLDSMTELSFLEDELGLSQREGPTILDIGAGYGRLAHRATAAVDGTSYICTDGVALSTFLCDYYLRFRAAEGTEVVPLDRIGPTLDGRRIDVAVNIHSFSECPVSTITWWLDLLAASDVEHLMIVPNTEDLLSVEASGDRIDFTPEIESRGFSLVVKRPKYAHSDAVQRHGIYPAQHYLFERR